MVVLGVAAGVLWVGISGYLMLLGRRQRAIARRLDGQPALGLAGKPAMGRAAQDPQT